jgi:D-sedoheptulose 7-phosphate isomerase
MDVLVSNSLKEHIAVFEQVLSDEMLQNTICKLSESIKDCLKNEGRVLICGNGGSAADAQHIAAEFVGRFQKERTAYDVEALTVNTSTLTAVGNDYGYNYIFSRQVEAKGRANDIFIGISTSGKSANVIEALKKSREKQMITAMMMGDYENEGLDDLCDFVIKVPSKVTARIQECHIFIGHMLAEMVEELLYTENN